MELELRNEGKVLVAKILSKRLDAAAAPDLKTKIGERITGGEHKIVIDLGAVDFVDSTGLGAALSLLKRLPPTGTLGLCGVRPPVKDLLRLTRLDRVFQVWPDQAAATAALAA
jgi:anti-sigma B factor antagonist